MNDPPPGGATWARAMRARATSAALVVVGLVSILAQIILLRELAVAFFGVELIYVLGLGVWLLGSGVGASLGPRRRAPAPAGLVVLFIVLATLLPIETVFLRSARLLFGGTPGAFLPLGRGLAALALGLLPPAVVSGLLFARAARRAVAEGRTFARAYALESLGGLLGGVGATAGLALGQPAWMLACIGALIALAGVVPLAPSVGRPPQALATLAAVALAAALGASPRIDAWTMRWNHPALVAARDTPYTRVAVERTGEQVSFFVNDALIFESEGVEAETFVQPVLLSHPAPARVAILGGAAEGLAQESLRHRPTRIEAVELDGAALDVVLAHLPPEQRGTLRAPSISLVRADPRSFLASAGEYDVILVGSADPDSGQTNRFFTREFFAACAPHLGTRGILGLRLRSAENLWTPQLARRMAAIHLALAAAFGDVLWLPGGTNVVLASQTPLPRDPELLVRRMRERGVVCRLVSGPYLRYLFTNGRVDEIARRLETTHVPMNTDARPICYTHAALLWLSRFFPGLGYADLGWLNAPTRVRAGAWVVVGLALVALVAPLRRSMRARRLALAFVAGLGGMLLEGVLILHYQTRVGALFQDIGLLITAFMGGLALGAWAAGRRTQGPARDTGRGMLVVGSLAGLALAVAALIGVAAPIGLVGLGALLLLAGALVGALLAHSSAGATDAGALAAPLYAADLAGGCLGAILGSLALVPLLGLGETSLAVALLACVALLLA